MFKKLIEMLMSLFSKAKTKVQEVQSTLTHPTPAEGTVTAPGKQPEIVAIVPKGDEPVPPKGTFLEDLTPRGYQLYVQNYREWPVSKNGPVKAVESGNVVPTEISGGQKAPPVAPADPQLASWISDFKFREKRDPTEEELADVKQRLKERMDNLTQAVQDRDKPGIGFPIWDKAKVDQILTRFDSYGTDDAGMKAKYKQLSTQEYIALQNRGMSSHSISININKANGQFYGPWA